MRNWIIAALTTGTLAVSAALAPADAMPAGGFDPAAVPSNVAQAQFIFGGRNYCWYDAGWRGPGYYWCGYAFRRGYGWGGGRGWNGWGGRPGFHGGGRPIVRPGFRPGGRPGGFRPGGGRPHH